MHEFSRILVGYWHHLLIVGFLDLYHLLLVVLVSVLVHLHIVLHLLHWLHLLLELTLVVLDNDLVLLKVKLL